LDKIKLEISHQLYGDRLHEKSWSREALGYLAELMPMSKREIFSVGWYLSENPDAAKRYSLSMALRYWADLSTKAIAWEEATYPPLTFSHPNPLK
jgi:hypothetical protein